MALDVEKTMFKLASPSERHVNTGISDIRRCHVEANTLSNRSLSGGDVAERLKAPLC
jgi:hypothetical protein